MSTNCSITLKIENIYKSIYCHHDSYPSYVRKILLKYYDTQKN